MWELSIYESGIKTRDIVKVECTKEEIKEICTFINIALKWTNYNKNIYVDYTKIE